MDDRPKDARSVFVRNIGYLVDEETLQTAFEDVGPVRKCFIVKDKDEKKHKGFGFVEFALPEDAERAISELQGKEVGGRKLKVGTARVSKRAGCVLSPTACHRHLSRATTTVCMHTVVVPRK